MLNDVLVEAVDAYLQGLCYIGYLESFEKINETFNLKHTMYSLTA